MTSGNVLRETRERKGYDLTTVARRLRIRPDILRAIEASDFASMPPRGYTRNMVNAYARFLGLNPTEIVNMYLDEAYAHQVEKARGSAPGSGFIMEGSYQRRPRLGRRSNHGDVDAGYGDGAQFSSYAEPGSDDEGYGLSSRNRARHLYDDRTQFSHDGYGVPRDSTERPGRSSRDFLSHHSGYPTDETGSINGLGGRERGRGRSRSIHVGETPMQYSAPRFPRVFQSRGVLIGAVALAVLVVIVIVFFVLGSGGDAESDDVSQLPVSGISDTTGTDDKAEAEEAQVEIAPTSARAVYSVDTGDECYVELYTDGELSSTELLDGPVQETVEVTGTWTVTTWSPDTIKVTVDGEEVELKSDEEYGGMYAYTVDFAKVLADWNSTHSSRSSQRSAAVASASNAAQKASDDDESSSSSSSSTSGGDADASDAADEGGGDGSGSE